MRAPDEARALFVGCAPLSFVGCAHPARQRAARHQEGLDRLALGVLAKTMVEDTCRWAAVADCRSLGGFAGGRQEAQFVDLPRCEQVTRGATLMQMLKVPEVPGREPRGQLLLQMLKQSGSYAGQARWSAAAAAEGTGGPPPRLEPAAGAAGGAPPRPPGQLGAWGPQELPPQPPLTVRAPREVEWLSPSVSGHAGATWVQPPPLCSAWPSGPATFADPAKSMLEEPDIGEASSGSDTYCTESDRDFAELARLIDESVQGQDTREWEAADTAWVASDTTRWAGMGTRPVQSKCLIRPR